DLNNNNVQFDKKVECHEIEGTVSHPEQESSARMDDLSLNNTVPRDEVFLLGFEKQTNRALVDNNNRCYNSLFSRYSFA
ncbi:17935_t:CDS:1, partial [Gigaspora rosea]